MPRFWCACTPGGMTVAFFHQCAPLHTFLIYFMFIGCFLTTVEGLQIALWVVATFGDRAQMSARDVASSIVRLAHRQHSSRKHELAMLAALFRVAAKAGPAASTLNAVLSPFLKPRVSSRDTSIARLASMTATAIAYDPVLGELCYTCLQ
jgi:hypothetical protein